jgi:glycerol dehydrogenase-like iron-containing ADH family enzyme
LVQYHGTVLRHREKSLKVTVTTILAVGSGAAMDLTKAVLQKGYGKGILVPSTYGAIIASTSSHAMLLDTTEDALVVPDNSLESNNTTVIIENDELAETHGNDAAWACMVMGMDSLYRRPDEDKSHLPEALASAGRALDYGFNDHLRSAPLALATSLIPPCFPSASIFTMLASLLPGILQVSLGT